jgi:chemotaxis protein methyltransferase CheR
VAELLSLEQFDLIRRLAMKHAGIALADYKRNMVHRRVSKRLEALGLDNCEEYCALLTGPEGERELQPLINVLTTNKTEFFREKHHFHHLATVATPELLKAKLALGTRRLRIWSAGCSSGEEPYSIAMTLCQSVPDLALWDAKILATDIDTDMVEQGRRAIYDAEDLSSVPLGVRAKFVEPVGADKRYRIAPSVRSRVVFKPLNLHDPWPMKGPFDVIFCRNVVIYFDKPTQCRLFDRFADILCDGSYLYIGHSESLYNVTERFRSIGQSIYQKIA